MFFRVHKLYTETLEHLKFSQKIHNGYLGQEQRMTFYLDPHEYENGAVLVHKRKDQPHGNWHCRIKVSAEQTYKRLSAGTTDLEQARLFAMRKFFEAQTLKEHGDTARLWARPFEKIADEFLAETEKRVDAGLATKSKLKRARIAVTFWKEYLGKTPITKLTADQLQGYELWRFSKNPDLQKTTILMDIGIFREIVKLAVRKRYVRQGDVPEIEYRVTQREKAKRPSFTDAEFTILRARLIEWTNATNLNPFLIRQRQQLYYVVSILGLTGMRVGEARSIKWSDIRHEAKPDEQNQFARWT